MNQDPYDGGFTITDQWLGERHLPTQPLELIADQHKMLIAMSKDGRAVVSQELRDDIAAYECILNDAMPKTRAAMYCDKRRENRSLRPREVARLMGWME